MTDHPLPTRALILDHALTLFADRGYNGVGVEELATTAGVTKPTLYHYFGNKQGVLEAIVVERYDPFIAELTAAASYKKDLPKSLTQVVYTFLRFGTEQATLFRMALAAELTARDDTAARIFHPRLDAQSQILRDLFLQASKDHGNMVGRHHLAAASLQATIVAYLQLAEDGEMTLDDGAVWRLIQQFSYGIYS